jgi:hypothetical protein
VHDLLQDCEAYGSEISSTKVKDITREALR